MSSYAPAQSKPVSIKLHADRRDLGLIDVAAEMQRTDRSSFIMDAACRRAEEVILNRSTFLIASSTFDAFEAALDTNPFEGNRSIVYLLQRTNRWG